MKKLTDNIAVVYELEMEKAVQKFIGTTIKQRKNYQIYSQEYFPTGELGRSFLEKLGAEHKSVLVVVSPRTETSIGLAEELRTYQDQNKLKNIYPVYFIE